MGPGAESGSEVVLAEVLALRSLFLNLQFRADKGQLSEAELRGLIERADATKLDRAREGLQAARAASQEANDFGTWVLARAHNPNAVQRQYLQ